MANLIYYIEIFKISLIALLAFIIIIKVFLFYSKEKGWDSVRFFYFSKIDLKMTTTKTMRLWRKRQNNLSVIILLISGLLAFTWLFHSLVKN